MYFKNFKFSEIFVHCTKNEIVTALGDQKIMSNILDLLHLLQQIRDAVDEPITINSAYRDSAHNKRVGGVSTSQHLLGQAADIKVPNMGWLYEKLNDFAKRYPNEIGQVIMYVPKCYERSERFNLADHATFFHIALPNEKYKTFTPSIKFQ